MNTDARKNYKKAIKALIAGEESARAELSVVANNADLHLLIEELALFRERVWSSATADSRVDSGSMELAPDASEDDGGGTASAQAGANTGQPPPDNRTAAIEHLAVNLARARKAFAAIVEQETPRPTTESWLPRKGRRVMEMIGNSKDEPESPAPEFLSYVDDIRNRLPVA
jgi:hypothetical protein